MSVAMGMILAYGICSLFGLFYSAGTYNLLHKKRMCIQNGEIKTSTPTPTPLRGPTTKKDNFFGGLPKTIEKRNNLESFSIRFQTF